MNHQDGNDKGGDNGGDNNSNGGEEEVGPQYLGDNDVEEVINIQENSEAGQLIEDIDDMELEQEDEEQEGAETEMVQDDAAVVFEKHKGSVFCVGIDPAHSSLVVTGGEDDKAFVWNLNTGDTLFECTGHKDSVTCIGFSWDSKYVATGDMSGLLKVWQVDTKQEVWSFEVSDLEWIEWHHGAPVLVAGTAEGDIWMWKIPSGDTKHFESHGSTCNIGHILPNGTTLVAGYEDGCVKVWDLKTASAMHTIQGHLAHTGSVTSMDCHHNNMLVITGSTDATAKVVNISTGKVLTTYNCALETSTDEEESVEAVAFCNSNNLVATGTLSGILTIWNTNSHTSRHQCKHQAGITRLKWEKDSTNIYTCTLDGIVHKWNALNGSLVAQWHGHGEDILDMALSSDGQSIVATSGDSKARVFKEQIQGR